MKNLENVIAQLTAKGIEFEVEFPQSYVKYRWDKDTINIDNSDTQSRPKLGIEISSFVWAWFEYTESTNHFSFLQRYNRNTGGVIKAWNTGYNIKTKLKEKHGVDLIGA